MSESDIAIVGAGAVGVNTALFLAKMGFSVELLEFAPDILQGSPGASFINHGDGFEYLKKGHRKTGEFCVDGSLVKGLIYPLRSLRTRICDEKHPIRFLVAKGSVAAGDISLNDFYQNARRMQSHFRRRFDAIRAQRGWSEDEAESWFLRRPRSFFSRLQASEFLDVLHVVGGCAGSSFGINMSHYYAILKAALGGSTVHFHPMAEVEAIERCGDRYQLHAGGLIFKVQQILLAAGHHVPSLVKKIRGADIAPPSPGTYYLNSMTFLRLPATTEVARKESLRRINFTLQQDYGCMFACVVPPSDTEDGLAVTYYPSARGSQLRSHIFDPAKPASPPIVWDELIREGLPSDSPSVASAFGQACTLYPFLRDYAEIIKTTCRTVFNSATMDSNGGTDRRVREVPATVSCISGDGRITSWSSPKWTNAEMVAMMATDYVSTQLRGVGLPKGTGKDSGVEFGPTRLEAAKIADWMGFQNIKINPQDALRYAHQQGLPERVVDLTMPSLAVPAVR